MWPYLIPLVFIFIGILNFDLPKYRTSNKILSGIILIYLILLSGISYRVGGDIYNYSYHYVDYPTLSEFSFAKYWDTGYQPLWMFLCCLAKSITPDFYLAHLFQSMIGLPIYFWWIRKNTKYFYTTILLFYLCVYPYFFFEVLREALAIAMVLIGYEKLKTNKYASFYFWVFMGFLFHISALIAIVIPFVRNVRLNKSFMWWCVGMICFVGLLSLYSQNILFFGKIYDRFTMYTEGMNQRLNINWYIVSIGRNVVIPLFILIWFKINKVNIKLEWTFCMFILLGIGVIEFAVIFERPVNYFLPFVVVSISEAMGNSYHRGLNRMIMSTFIFVLFWFGNRGAFYIRDEQWRLLLPYESIFSREKNMEREAMLRRYWGYKQNSW